MFRPRRALGTTSSSRLETDLRRQPLTTLQSSCRSGHWRALFFAVISVFSLAGCLESPGEKLHQIEGRTMGTTYSVKFFAEGAGQVAKVKERVQADLLEVNRQMSTYLKNSEISKVNRAPAGTSVAISDWFAETLALSLELASQTRGRFDPTVGPLVNLWGFGPANGQEKAPPSREEIQAVKSHVGFEKVQLAKNQEGWQVAKSHDKVFVDLSASAKGFGVDVISEALLEMGLKNHLVEIGGELRARGKKNTENWRVAIEKPDPEKRSVQKIIALREMSLATSGSYRNFFTSGGKSYSHTIDSDTGEPVQNRLISVSVLDGNCVRADALATALMAMGVEAAWEFAQNNQLAVYMIHGKNETGKLKTAVRVTDQFLSLGRIQ